MGMRFIYTPIVFGKKECRIKGYSWDSERQVADITYVDENGVEYSTTALGMSDLEIRKAVLDTIIQDYNRP